MGRIGRAGTVVTRARSLPSCGVAAMAGALPMGGMAWLSEALVRLEEAADLGHATSYCVCTHN